MSGLVLSRAALRAGYDRSLFARMADAGHPVHMLRVQYRCHPRISAFPSHYFYGGRLLDGDSVRGRGRFRARRLHRLLVHDLLVFHRVGAATRAQRQRHR